ncbi:TPA: hypothetical protein ACPY8A_000198 [Yersinia enterocolitica]
MCKKSGWPNLVLAGVAAKDTAMEQGCDFRRLFPAAAIAQASSLANHNRLSTTFDHLELLGLNAVFRPNHLVGNLHQRLL